MRKSIILVIALLAFSSNAIHAGRNAGAVSNVTIKNTSSKNITIGTHNGTKVIKPNNSETIQVVRGQSYDIVANTPDKSKKEVGRTSTKFTQGDYTIAAPADKTSSDPDAVSIKVTKPTATDAQKQQSRSPYYSSSYNDEDYY